jgi:hypothetical protein
MILNARQNGFIFNFPKGYFGKALESKYSSYINRMPIPFDSLGDFMNSTIQQVSFPTFQGIDHVEQTRPGGYKQSYKSATNIQNLIRRDFNVTFKLGEGFINYWIMYESMVNFLDFGNKQEYLPDLTLRLLDHEGVIMSSVQFEQPIYTSLSEVQLNFSSTTPQFSSFSVGFRCNYVKIKLEIG